MSTKRTWVARLALIIAAFIAVTACGSSPPPIDLGEGRTAFERDTVIGLKESQAVHGDAKCDPGSVLIGGGHVVANASVDSSRILEVRASYPLDAMTWRTTVYQPPDLDDSQLPLAVSKAICLADPSNPPQVVVEQSDSVSDGRPDGSATVESASASALCPTGSVRTAGGFKIDEYDLADLDAGLLNAYAAESKPVGSDGWTSTVRRVWDSDYRRLRVQSFALCVLSGLDAVTVVEQNVSPAPFPANNQIADVYTYATISCAPSQLPTGGGFDSMGGWQFGWISESRSHFEDRSWRMAAGLTPGVSGSFGAYLLCTDDG